MNKEIVFSIIDKNLNEFDDDMPLNQISKTIERKYNEMWRDEIKLPLKLKELRDIIKKYDLRDDRNKLIKGRSKKIIIERCLHFFP